METTIFKNLLTALEAEENKRLTESLEKITTAPLSELLSSWWYRSLLPKGKDVSGMNEADLKAYLVKRITKRTNQAIKEHREHLQRVQDAPDFTDATITMEWKKSRMWGNNPNAEARVKEGNLYASYKSGSIVGCGYDKGSTAVATALNQSYSFLKLLYLHKEQHPTAENRELFGYGSGYGILPRLEGGVGVGCYPRIMESVGLKFNTTASGKMFDVYTIDK